MNITSTEEKALNFCGPINGKKKSWKWCHLCADKMERKPLTRKESKECCPWRMIKN
jgi:hypothetical protein